MEFIRIIYKDILKRPSLYFFVFLIVYTIDRHERLEYSSHLELGPLYSDVQEYYSFLPDIFLKEKSLIKFRPETNKRTIGMAILYSPFFLLGHTIASNTNATTNGYSLPYQQSMRWGNIFYVLLGLFFLRRVLLYFFKEVVVLITLICFLFGTNLFFYTYSSPGMPHSYLFCLYTLFMYFVFKWLFDQKHKYLIGFSFLAGMITLIRPTGIIVLLFPLLYDVDSFKSFVVRLQLLFKKPLIVFFAALIFLLPILLQLCYWKNYLGQFVMYSYGKEGFFFKDPQIFNFLFSYRKGWLLYTPIMVFSLVGLMMSRRFLKPFFLFNLLYLFVSVYILSSWWDWAYGGSFGCRVLIESYAFLSLPFAVFVTWVWNLFQNSMPSQIVCRTLCLLLFYLLIELNFFQSVQYRNTVIHWSGMNKETYNYIFLKSEITKEDRTYLEANYYTPDAERMLKGDRDE